MILDQFRLDGKIALSGAKNENQQDADPLPVVPRDLCPAL
jgi:hypothetical protein